MEKKLLFILLIASAAHLPALDFSQTQPLVSGDVSSIRLLQHKYIFAETSGAVPVDLRSAVSIMEQPSFLARVQEEYERMLPPGKRPEFTVQQSSSNTWFFINGDQERTDIIEIAERMDDGIFDLAYFTQGRRFFGEYQALIHIRLTGNRGSTAYTVAVYAYPENGLSRFFARHLNLVERYFRSKTDEISGLAVQISTQLCTPDQTVAMSQTNR